MEFLILFGGLCAFMALIMRKHLLWVADENACDYEKEKKEVKVNHIAYYSMLYGGLALMVIGVLFGFII